MESVRHNTSSDLIGLFPYHVSGTSPEPVHGSVHDASPEESSVNRRLSQQGQAGDSVALSGPARRLYEASSSGGTSGVSVASLLSPASDNIGAYPARRVHSGFEPLDPPAELVAAPESQVDTDNKPTVEEFNFFTTNRTEDVPLAEQLPERPLETRFASRESVNSGSPSKKQHIQLSDDSSVFSSPFSYTNPEASANAPVRGMRASSSSSRVYGYIPSNNGSADSFSMPRLSRMA